MKNLESHKINEKYDKLTKIFPKLIGIGFILFVIFMALKLGAIGYFFFSISLLSLGVLLIITGYFGLFKKFTLSLADFVGVAIGGVWYFVLKYIIKKPKYKDLASYSRSPIWSRVLGIISLLLGFVVFLAGVGVFFWGLYKLLFSN
jgi:hypothetical protein